MRPGSELLVRLLEKYERSAAFGQPGPWRQDVIVRLDAREFPAAFEPEGREAPADLRAAVALAPGASGWERVISERIFGQSKRLAAVRALVLEILLRADPRWDGVSRDDAGDVLEAYGVRRKAGLIRCAGRGTMEVAGYA